MSQSTRNITGSSEALPAISLSFRDVSLAVDVPVDDHDVSTVTTSLLGIARKPFSKKAMRTVPVLSNVSFDAKPGSSTLIIGGPGSGKTSFLRLAAGRSLKGIEKTGDITFSGLTAEEINQVATLPRLVKLVETQDEHMALLTVRETLEYSEKFQCTPDHASEKTIKSRVESIIRLLQLENAADTYVGNEFLRGISGGEKKRLTIGEGLIGRPRLLLLDEYTTGLDSSTANDITNALTGWARESGGTLIASALQPTPEMLASFTDLVLLQDGFLVFHGPPAEALAFIETSAGIKCPADRDPADFINDFLVDPTSSVAAARKAAKLSTDSTAETKTEEPTSESKATELTSDVIQVTADSSSSFAVISAAELSAAYRAKQLLASPSASKQGAALLPSDFARRQYGTEAILPWSSQIALTTQRQARVFGRDKDTLVGPWVMQAIMIGLLLGSLFWGLDIEDFPIKSGLWLFLVTMLFGFNLTILPIEGTNKKVVEKQVDAGQYVPSSHVLGAALVQLPFSMVNILTTCTIAYWMSGLSPVFTDYLMFLAVAFGADLALSSAFRFITLASPSITVAEVATPLAVVAAFIFSGVVVTRTNIPDWLIWAYYISPLSYTIRAWAIIEARSDTYDGRLTSEGRPLGIQALEDLDFQTGREWIWVAIAYLLSFYLVTLLLSIFTLKHLRYAGSPGATRVPNDSSTSSIKVGKKQQAALPVQSVSMSWSNLNFSVKLKNGEMKQLLHNINGYARPGRLCALMGASGAGKTTLLNVLSESGVKGVVDGNITVGGKQRDALPIPFRRLAGYVQQDDAHLKTTTVREAITFSAALRLPSSVTAERREALVVEILDLLELTPMAEWQVGGDELSGISAGQRKLLTVAVELAASPAILFCDEPTTGLDGRAAANVVRILKRVAATGRAVICTIHQPSFELFAQFDDLLLLQRGGVSAFCGPIGSRGSKVVEYFEALPGVTPMPTGMNPATWMVEVVAEHGGTLKLPEILKASATGEALKAETAAAAAVDTSLSFHEEAYAGLAKQTKVVIGRHIQVYNRDLGYSLSRILAFTFLGLVFGLVFFDLGSDSLADVQSTIGALMLVSGFNGILLLQTAGPFYFTLRDAFYRETAGQFYSPIAFAIASILIETLWAAFLMMLGVIAAYFLIGFDTDADRFFTFYFATMVVGIVLALNGVAFGMALPDHQILQLATGGTQNISWLFNGFFIPLARAPIGYKWLFALSPYSHAINVLSMSQFQGKTNLITNPNGVDQPLQQYIEDQYDFDWDSRYAELGYTSLWIIFWAALAVFAIYRVRHIK